MRPGRVPGDRRRLTREPDPKQHGGRDAVHRQVRGLMSRPARSPCALDVCAQPRVYGAVWVRFLDHTPGVVCEESGCAACDAAACPLRGSVGRRHFLRWSAAIRAALSRLAANGLEVRNTRKHAPDFPFLTSFSFRAITRVSRPRTCRGSAHRTRCRTASEPAPRRGRTDDARQHTGITLRSAPSQAACAAWRASSSLAMVARCTSSGPSARRSERAPA